MRRLHGIAVHIDAVDPRLAGETQRAIHIVDRLAVVELEGTVCSGLAAAEQRYLALAIGPRRHGCDAQIGGRQPFFGEAGGSGRGALAIQPTKEGFDLCILLELQAPASGQHLVQLVDVDFRHLGEASLGDAMALQRLFDLDRCHESSLRIAQILVYCDLSEFRLTLYAIIAKSKDMFQPENKSPSAVAPSLGGGACGRHRLDPPTRLFWCRPLLYWMRA